MEQEDTRMKKEHLPTILLFGGLWGFSEAILGDALYSAAVPFASVYLTVIGFFLLAVAAQFVPHRGGSTVIASLAMLYKFLNVPFFACHLTGIALLGLSFDLVFGWGSRETHAAPGSTPGNRQSLRVAGLKAAFACYLGHTLFFLAMIFVFRSEFWRGKGSGGLWQHVGVGGSLAAAGCALAVPVGLVLGRRLRDRVSGSAPSYFQPRLVGTLTTILTVGLWAWGMAAKWRNG
jgi:hypothetical protein